MSRLEVTDGAGFVAGDTVHLRGDPTPYVITGLRHGALQISPVWWWQLLLDLLAVFE